MGQAVKKLPSSLMQFLLTKDKPLVKLFLPSKLNVNLVDEGLNKGCFKYSSYH